MVNSWMLNVLDEKANGLVQFSAQYSSIPTISLASKEASVRISDFLLEEIQSEWIITKQNSISSVEKFLLSKSLMYVLPNLKFFLTL